MQKRYWAMVHRYALKETRDLLRVETRARLMVVFVVAAVGVALIWMLDGGNHAWSVIVAKSAASAAIVLLFPLIYFGRFLLAPASLDEDLRSKLEAKNGYLEINEKIDEYWHQGNDLLERTGTEDTAAKKVEWTVSVERYLKNVGLLDEAVGFLTIATFEGKLNKLRKIWMRAASKARTA